MSNKIETIESGTFQNLVKLSTIDLSQNRLKKIERHSFQNMTSLVLLDLSHNYLDQLIDVFGENVNINILDLSFNFFRQIERSVPVRILNLNIYFNGIKVIRDDFLKEYFSQISSI